ncbi:hypothetical protein Cob_v005430 [Colletotrichum orbiculare MAFF 240422]|uniref:Uncharacterized protein n=1 Tax=Colletotrichum orbiculare (strain 104-T / ATCC 96160 / CBS 514.97 / LARS 414 / MAFF 240422) TaxID=1213857 RepID=A0A484FUJ8_COLOR|nr:hypothetical protein Cob_v005430 [Colletotrichum orbiculare MAFF 240422]
MASTVNKSGSGTEEQATDIVGLTYYVSRGNDQAHSAPERVLLADPDIGVGASDPSGASIGSCFRAASSPLLSATSQLVLGIYKNDPIAPLEMALHDVSAMCLERDFAIIESPASSN